MQKSHYTMMPWRAYYLNSPGLRGHANKEDRLPWQFGNYNAIRDQLLITGRGPTK